MRRYHQEKHIARRHHREHLRAVHGWPKKPVDCPCDKQEGRFFKRDAHDCGHARCMICHSQKFINHGKHIETRAEELATLNLAEQVAEL